MYNKPERERGGVLMKMKPIGDLVQQLSHSKLELRQLLLLCHVGIVDGVLPNLKKKISVTIVKIIIGSVMMIMTQQQHGLWQPFRMSIIQMGDMCACLDVKMDPQLSAGEPLGGVAEKNLVKKAYNRNVGGTCTSR